MVIHNTYNVFVVVAQGDVSSTSDSTVSTTTDGTTTDSSAIVEPGTEPIVPRPK